MNERLLVRASELLQTCKVGALATSDRGAPVVSMTPYALDAQRWATLVLVSRLAAHTRNMLADPRVGFMVMQCASESASAHALARLSLQGNAVAIAPKDAGYADARACYTARFPDMRGLFELGDFVLFAIEPVAARMVAGFAEAASISPDLLARRLRE
jgi:putative heme iron utilization protein